MFNPEEKRIVTVVSVAHFLTHMFVLIFPAVVMPYAREYGLQPSEIFPLGFYMYFLYGASAIPAGYFADHWSRIGILKICVAGMSLGSLLAGFSQNETVFMAGLALIGLFCGFFHPAGMGIIAHHIKKQGSAHGINGIFGNLGIAAAPFFTGLILLSLNWRSVFLFMAGLGAAGYALILLLPINEKRDEEEPAKKNAKSGKRNDNAIYFLILCGSMTMAGLVYRAYMTSLPTLMETEASELIGFIQSAFRSLGSSNAPSGISALLVSTLFFFSMVAQFIGGKAADRFDLRWAYFIFHASAIPFAFAISQLSDLPLYFAAVGLVFFTLGMQPIENSLVPKFLPKKWLSTGYGIKFTLVFGLGSFAVHQVAFVDDRWGIRKVFSFLTFETMITAGFALALIIASRSIKRIENG